MVVRHLVWVAAGVSSLVAGCSDGGGLRLFPASVTLLAVTFPDPNDVNVEPPDAAPQNAPLVQTIVFTFSVAPDPDRINATVLPILDEVSKLPVPGRYEIAGPEVTFIPDLPTRPVTTLSSGALDDGGAGLDFNRGYLVRVGPKTFSFVANVAVDLRTRFPDPLDSKGIALTFRSMPTLTADSFRALEEKRPQLLAADPADGATGVSPNFFSDPDALFAERRPFQLLFDAPIKPDATVVNDAVFELFDLDDRPAQFPAGLPLGIEVELLENRADRAVVQITPTGILPFGHLLALQYDAELKGLSESGTPAGGPLLATTFTVAADPGGALRDAIVETFDDNDREEADLTQIGNGNLPADWNRDRSGILQAAFEFDGTGVLGRFVPTGPGSGGTNSIVLNTASQTFPLPDGSTPDAPPGYVVTGGVFHFTDVDIGDGVEIRAAGSNPLVFLCTGSVRIAGDIDIGGENGTGEYGYDSAVTAIPGGAATAGGGRGGDAHPAVFFPPDTFSYLTLVSPTYASAGFGIDPADGVMKRIGGTGAQSGILDRKDSHGKYQTNHEWMSCDEFRSITTNCKLPGGGGGSMLREGATPHDTSGTVLNGVSNVHPDGAGGWVVLDDESCLAGVGGAHPFASDGTSNNDYYGKLGQLQRLIGGQGGGGGGSLCDNYYCGNWCDLDADPANDACCNNGDGLPARGFAPSVGDSRGGGGGGGGGAFLLQSLGDISVEATGSVLANGGKGGGGEGIACSYWGGSGGGGAGGMIVLQSASAILVEQGGVLDVRRGFGDNAAPNNDYFDCSDSATGAIGDGGDGGHGLIQLQVPVGTTATVVQPGTTDINGSLRPPTSWIDPTNTLAPVEFTPLSVALSRWYDFGHVIARGPGLPALSFSGLDANGFVATDGAGNILSPATTDILCGYLGQIDPISKTYLPDEEPRAHFIPTNATVKVEFQGADAIVEGSKEVDPATLTAWSSDVTVANGRQFLRWRVTFDTTADGSNLTRSSRRPIVERVQIHADF